MAIQGNYNINNAGDAYKAWYNYNYGGNTLNVSAEDIGEIQNKYSKEIATTWAMRATNDNTQYEITDDEKTEAKNSGEERGKNVSEHDGSTDGVGSAVASTGAAIGGVASATAAVWAGIAASKKGSVSLAGTIIAATGAAVSLAAGTYLVTAKPNEEPAKACEKLTEEMGTAQSEISEQDSIMEAADEELSSLSEDAEELNEDANKENEENHADFSIFKEIYDSLMQKVQNGEPLTDEEKEELKSIIPILQELGVTIEETTEETSDEVNDIYDEMGEQQDTFDEASEKIEEINGLTDFAAGFDEATKENAEMVGVTAQLGMYGSGLLTAAGITGMIAGKGKLFTLWGAAEGATQIAVGATVLGMSAASAVEFGIAKGQQSEYAQLAETEIGAREATQDLNSGLSDVYDERIDGFEGYLGSVEDLELEVPDDTKMPDEVEIPENTEEPPKEPEPTDKNVDPNNNNKDDDDKNKKSKNDDDKK